MFSCVQEPPLIASPPEVDWCGRLLGHTREETTICIKGVPGDFVADQPEHTDNEEALCQPDDKKAFDAHHLHERFRLLNTRPLRLILPLPINPAV